MERSKTLSGNTPTEAAIGLGFCSLDAMLHIDERVALAQDIERHRRARLLPDDSSEIIIT